MTPVPVPPAPDGPPQPARALADDESMSINDAWRIILDAMDTDDPRLHELLARDGMTMDSFIDRIVAAYRD